MLNFWEEKEHVKTEINSDREIKNRCDLQRLLISDFLVLSKRIIIAGLLDLFCLVLQQQQSNGIKQSIL